MVLKKTRARVWVDPAPSLGGRGRKADLALFIWEVARLPPKRSQAHVINILPGFQTGAGASLTRTWTG